MKKAMVFLLLSISFLFAQSKYCNSLSGKRSTIIYIDLSSAKGKDWIHNLEKNLKGSFLPHERVRVYYINPQTSEVKEVFNTCAPILSQDEIKKIKKSGKWYLFGGNPIDEAHDDLMIFYSTLGNVLKNADRHYVDSDNDPLVEILYNEGDKFETPFHRVILFSNMIENSQDFPLKSVLNGTAKKKVSEYSVNFNYSNVYVVLNKKMLKGSQFLKLKKFWHYYFEKNNASLKNFNTTFDLPNYHQFNIKKYSGTMNYPDGSKFHIKILLGYNKKGKIVNGWFVLNDIDSVPVEGRVISKNGKIKKIKLKVKNTVDGIHVLYNGEVINISFHNKQGKGVILFENTQTVIKTPKGNILKNPKITLQLQEYSE